MVEAGVQLARGLSMVANLPDEVLRQQYELDLQIALGQALMATQGWGSPEVAAASDRARQLCAQLNQPPQLIQVLYGQWVNHVIHAKLALAHQLALEMRQSGEDRGDANTRVIGGRLTGVTDYLLGRFSASRAALEQSLVLFDPTQRSFYATLSANDTRVTVMTFLSRALIALGYLDQGKLMAQEAIAEARELSHPFTLGYALHWMVLGAWGVEPSPSLLQRAEELNALAHEQNFPFLVSGATIYHGWCMAALGREQQGIAQLTHGLSAFRATGANLAFPLCLTLLADAYGKAHQPKQGLIQLSEAERLVEATEERWAEAEMYRVRGELLIAMEDFDAAEASFRRAATVAQHQSAKLFELRAATSLARLWRDQGRHAEARDLLAPIYGWFTEGFDTPDLKEAKALLDELA
jgi:predicted ATPase